MSFWFPIRTHTGRLYNSFCFRFSCWISSSNGLIWIFVSFVLAIEIVSSVSIFFNLIKKVTHKNVLKEKQREWFKGFVFTTKITSVTITWAVLWYSNLSFLFSQLCYFFQINLLILVRVIREMTKMEQTKDNQGEQIRSHRFYCLF